MSDASSRLVLITGASGGIGRVTALAFAHRGDRVIAVARSGDRLQTLADEQERIFPYVADVSDVASMSSMCERVRADHGVPDVIVANAGLGLDALFTETTDDLLHRLFETNVVGVYRTVRPFLDAMVERGSGRVLIVSSIVGKRGVPHYSGYSASKFALHGVADAMRAELWETGVTVGVVCPSSTETEFHDNAMSKGPRQRRNRPVHRSAESVARAIVSMAGSRRHEMILGGEAKLMTFVDLIAPGLIDRILARSLTRRAGD